MTCQPVEKTRAVSAASSDCCISTLAKASGSSVQEKHELLAAYKPDLSSLSARACIDWIEFLVTLPRPSQFRHLKARTAKPWGKVFFTEVDGTNGKTWKFRVQNPPGPVQFMEEVQAMVRPGDAAFTEQDIRVVGIEVALDFRHATNDRQALIHTALHCIRHQARPLAGSPRITRKGGVVTPVYPHEVLEALSDKKSTIRSGRKGDDHTCRFYFKDYDSFNGKRYAALPPDKWCARFENTLIGNAVPFKTIQEWRDFKFESMSKDLFAMVMPTPTTSKLVTSLQARMIQLGRRPDSYIRPGTERRQRGAGTCRDSVLNDKIRQALRSLTARQNSVKESPDNPEPPLERLPIPTVFPKYIHKSIVTKWLNLPVWPSPRDPPHYLCRSRRMAQPSVKRFPSCLKERYEKRIIKIRERITCDTWLERDGH